MGTHFHHTVYFDTTTYEWVLVPKKELNFCIRKSMKEVGSAIISLYQIYDMLNYGIVTIKDVEKIKDISENIMFTTYFKTIEYFDILNVDGDLVGTSNLLVRSCIDKDYITNYERGFYKTFELLKYKYKIKDNYIPNEIWNIISSYFEPYQQKIMCSFDGNAEYCQEKAYDLYIYESSRLQETFYYYALPYPHTRKEARRAICKYNNWDDEICGLNLVSRGNLIKEDYSDSYSIYLFKINRFCNSTNININTNIKFINKEAEEIYSNSVLEYDVFQSYKINGIYTL